MAKDPKGQTRQTLLISPIAIHEWALEPNGNMNSATSNLTSICQEHHLGRNLLGQPKQIRGVGPHRLKPSAVTTGQSARHHFNRRGQTPMTGCCLG